MPVTIGCRDFAADVILRNVRQTVTSQEFERITSDPKFRDWLEKVNQAFVRRMVKEWGSDKYIV